MFSSGAGVCHPCSLWGSQHRDPVLEALARLDSLGLSAEFRPTALWVGFIAPFLSCSLFILNILLFLATVLIGRISKKKKSQLTWIVEGLFTSSNF